MGNRLRTATAFLASLALVVLSGCGGAGQPAAPEAKQEKPAASKPVTINFTHWRNEDMEILKKLADKFHQENPNITVEFTVVPSTNYQAQVQGAILSGQGADLFASFPGSQFASLVESNAYADLSSEPFLSNFEPHLIAAGKANGKQFAVPYQLVFNTPIYNVDLFKKFGVEVPKDWDGFLNLCTTLKSKGVIPIIFSGTVSAGQFFNTMVMNNAPNEDILRQVETRQAKLTDEWFVKTLKQFKELQEKGCFQEGALGTSQAAGQTLFAQEKGAILATGSYDMAPAKKQNPKLNMDLIAPITTTADKAVWQGIHTTTFMLGVNARSPHQAEAKKLIAFLARPENASEYANATGQMVTVKGVTYASPELKVSQAWTAKKTRFQVRFTGTVPQVFDALTTAVQAVLSGKAPEAAAREAQESIEKVLK